MRYGDIVSVDNTVEYYREPFGRQVYVKAYRKKILVLIHAFERAEPVFLPLNGYRLQRAYTNLPYSFVDGTLCVTGQGDYESGAFLLERD